MKRSPLKRRTPLKSKPKKAATKAEKDRMAAIAEMGICLACRIEKVRPDTPIEIHHLTDCGRRRGHMLTIGLCRWHHRGEPHWQDTKPSARVVYGPSFAEDAECFRASYGTDDELLAMQNRLLENPNG